MAGEGAGSLRLVRAMRIKFLATCVSDAPDHPFQAGQIVTLPGSELPAYFRSYVKRGEAILLPDDATERAIEPETEQSEPVRTKGRKRAADGL